MILKMWHERWHWIGSEEMKYWADAEGAIEGKKDWVIILNDWFENKRWSFLE